MRGRSLSGSPKVVCNHSDVRVAPRKNEVKQQQDWRLVFVDRPETFQIIDCLDELMSTRECFHRDLLSRSMCVAACLPEISHEVRLRSVQTEQASLAPERVPEAGSKDNVVRVAPRTTEVKQQQDLRLVFVDRPETYRIIDCWTTSWVRTLALTEICCPGASAQLGACPWSATRCVPERTRIGMCEPGTTRC